MTWLKISCLYKNQGGFMKYWKFVEYFQLTDFEEFETPPQMREFQNSL